ncbi:transposase [Streptomyces sp. NPDC059491]|uniref:transposase n=1 Tax=Streptomyces sp. NPDC059491 TaxID=3346850 RepID=UPI00369FF25D
MVGRVTVGLDGRAVGAGGAVASTSTEEAEGRASTEHPRRRTIDAIFCVVRTGRAWRQLPKDFARSRRPWSTTPLPALAARHRSGVRTAMGASATRQSRR